MVSCFFIAARFELADEFPNTQPRSGAGVREEPPEEVPIKSGKSESPRPKEAGYRLVSCFFIAARFELADEFPNTQPRSGAGVREEPPEEVPIKSGKSESPRPCKAGFNLLVIFYLLFGLIMRNFKTKYVSLALHSLFLPRSLPPPMLLPNLITYKKEPCFVFRF